jgi:RimJ/RimL family protein N-acetyltransferase
MTILHGLLVDLVPFDREWRDEKMVAFWNSESRLWATMGDHGPVSRAQIARIQQERDEGREQGWTGVYFMMRARDGQIIGSMGLNWVNYWHRSAELGAWIGEREYWGGGYGTDGLLLVCEYAFRWLDLRRLVLGTMHLNERARRNAEKVGFRQEARQRKVALVNGEWVDDITYGLLREEWRGREALVEALGLRQRAEQRYGVLEG